MYTYLILSVLIPVTSIIYASGETVEIRYYVDAKSGLKLPFHNFSKTKISRMMMPYLGEGCCTTLTKVGQKMVVGPIGPNQLIVLHNMGKTIVAQRDECASLVSLVKLAKATFGDKTPKTKGLVFTNLIPHYYGVDEKVGAAWCDGYQGRSQEDEVELVANKLRYYLEIGKEGHITQRFFNVSFNENEPAEKDYAIEFFVVVEHRGNDVAYYSISPITEALFGLPHQSPVSDTTIKALKHKMIEMRRENPYLKPILAKNMLTKSEWEACYDSYDFVHIPQ